MYKQGTGVPQDHTEAARLYQLAADQGNATGQYNLALMYYNGTGVARDPTKAVQLLKLAAKQGYQLARDGLVLFTGV